MQVRDLINELRRFEQDAEVKCELEFGNIASRTTREGKAEKIERDNYDSTVVIKCYD